MRILLVEDDHRLAASLRRNLGEDGIAADAVHDGEEGLEAAQTTPYDVILLDVMLPGLDGMEVRPVHEVFAGAVVQSNADRHPRTRLV
jgi:DNA-binding response OmpR family regulator